MKLSEHERNMIARRAAGEYAVIPAVRRIMGEHRRNRNPDDAPFLEFARLILQKSWSWDDYERTARAVLEIVPEPWGPDVAAHRARSTADAMPPAPAPPKRRRKCGLCSEPGHNARTCPSKPSTPTMKLDDGIERLTPGFDPNPPVADDDPSD